MTVIRKKNTPWTTLKIARLRECYEAMSYAELLVEFAPHPIRSIRGTAYRLGLRRQTKRRWHAICASHKPVILCWRGTI